MAEMKTAETLTDEIISATTFIEVAAETWQEDYPDALPACFLMASAKFIADSFAPVSDDAFEALLLKMREERSDWQKRKSDGNR